MTDLSFAKKVAMVSGGRILRGKSRMRRLQDKANREAVTDLDCSINAFILHEIERTFPDDDILSEEDDPIEKGRSDRLWIVDPIDGTVNLMAGIPQYVVSVALWSDGVPRVGVVYDPVHRELFTASAGKGARLNGRRLQTSQVSVRDGMVLYAQSYNQKQAEHGWERVRRIRAASLHDRQLGSLALMLCYVASARATLLVSTGGKAWDSAAGRLIVEEAGGMVTNMEGETWGLASSSVLAGHPSVHAEALRLV